MKSRYLFIALIIVLLIFGALAFLITKNNYQQTISPLGKIREKPLDKYTIESLSKRSWRASQITLENAVATTSAYTAYIFSFTSDNRRVTGLAHIPSGASSHNPKPVVVQLRGWVDREKYEPGIGTQRSAEVLARNGFISLAPDFLGYAGSDNPSSDIFEERFETYTTVLDLLSSIKSLSLADAEKIGIWGHSNGGQIALTVLEVIHKSYPTVLWAPVSKPFPYSILYYTDEASDGGKLLRMRLAEFEKNYDTDLYSAFNYLDWINAPLQIHQGSADEAVPQKWSTELVKQLKEKQKEVVYFTYPYADHNLTPGWDLVVARDIQFFNRNLRQK